MNFILVCSLCWYEYFNSGVSAGDVPDPNVFLSAPEILERHGVYENHSVTTEDGYILTLFRIPKKNAKGVVILQHPISTDSTAFILQSDQSLAFLMSKEGYDVWLPNHRGTPFSNRHVKLKYTDFEYWNFSFHEIGIYDYSSSIQYIKEKTGRSDLVFIGHSMSTTASLVYASLKPEEAKNSVKVFIELSTTAYLRHVTSPAKLIAPFEPLLREHAEFLKFGALFTSNSLERFLTTLLTFLPVQSIVTFTLSLFSGWTPEEFDLGLFKAATAHVPVALPSKMIFHYAQIVNSKGIFQQYDYRADNKRIYNSTHPPEYPVEKIVVPIYMISSTSDTLATVEDAHFMYNKLSKEAKIYGKLDISGLNHVDFHVGKSRVRKVFVPIFKLLRHIL